MWKPLLYAQEAGYNNPNPSVDGVVAPFRSVVCSRGNTDRVESLSDSLSVGAGYVPSNHTVLPMYSSVRLHTSSLHNGGGGCGRYL